MVCASISVLGDVSTLLIKANSVPKDMSYLSLSLQKNVLVVASVAGFVPISPSRSFDLTRNSQQEFVRRQVLPCSNTNMVAEKPI